jgi:hypothetical protein
MKERHLKLQAARGRGGVSAPKLTREYIMAMKERNLKLKASRGGR